MSTHDRHGTKQQNIPYREMYVFFLLLGESWISYVCIICSCLKRQPCFSVFGRCLYLHKLMCCIHCVLSNRWIHFPLWLCLVRVHVAVRSPLRADVQHCSCAHWPPCICVDLQFLWLLVTYQQKTACGSVTEHSPLVGGEAALRQSIYIRKKAAVYKKKKNVNVSEWSSVDLVVYEKKRVRIRVAFLNINN